MTLALAGPGVKAGPPLCSPGGLAYDLKFTLRAQLHDRGMEVFIIRVWRAGEQEISLGPRHLRGVIEHVRLGERRIFKDGGHLLALLHGGLQEPSDASDLRAGLEDDLNQ
jgi:hypothetical protein